MRNLFKLAVVGAMVWAAPVWGRAHSSSSTISISATVERFAEWADAGPVVVESDWPAINKANQTRTISKPLTLYTNTDAAITAQPGENGGVLTRGSQSLNTAYRITGKVTNPDSAFKAAGSGAGEFFNSNNIYSVTHETGVGAYPINLDVQISSPADMAVDPGLYHCTLTLTVGW